MLGLLSFLVMPYYHLDWWESVSRGLQEMLSHVLSAIFFSNVPQLVWSIRKLFIYTYVTVIVDKVFIVIKKLHGVQVRNKCSAIRESHALLMHIGIP